MLTFCLLFSVVSWFTATSNFSKLNNASLTTSSAVTSDKPATDSTALHPGTSSSARRPRFANRKRPRLADHAEDGQLFNKWLSSEIECNSVKIELMKAKQDLVELTKQKTILEIQKLQAETAIFAFET